ncbi:MAG: hypothetical protein JO288_06610 [Hyphomicrobiales bacterium]|nr:hypothetical protein [Hyphomicrobiales bacterium]
MRFVVTLILIIYLVGVGVVLAPTVRAKWSAAPASDFAQSIGQELPYALSWPARVVHGNNAS